MRRHRGQDVFASFKPRGALPSWPWASRVSHESQSWLVRGSLALITLGTLAAFSSTLLDFNPRPMLASFDTLADSVRGPNSSTSISMSMSGPGGLWRRSLGAPPPSTPNGSADAPSASSPSWFPQLSLVPGAGVVTIVTYYGKLGRSKHSAEEYVTWGKRFMDIKAPLVFFCHQPSDSCDLLKLRDPTLPLLSLSADHWRVPFLENVVDALRNESEQWAKDPERNIHSPDLYAVWNSKPWFVWEAARLNPFNSSFFFWVDVGSFRGGFEPVDWPDDQRVRQVFQQIPSEAMLFGGIGPNFLEDLKRAWEGQPGQRQSVCTDTAFAIQGNFFAGRKEAITWYMEENRRVMERGERQGEFVGKDQVNICYTVLENFGRLALLRAWEVGRVLNGGLDWWFFQYFFSKEEKYHRPLFIPALEPYLGVGDKDNFWGASRPAGAMPRQLLSSHVEQSPGPAQSPASETSLPSNTSAAC